MPFKKRLEKTDTHEKKYQKSKTANEQQYTKLFYFPNCVHIDQISGCPKTNIQHDVKTGKNYQIRVETNRLCGFTSKECIKLFFREQERLLKPHALNSI